MPSPGAQIAVERAHPLRTEVDSARITALANNAETPAKRVYVVDLGVAPETFRGLSVTVAHRLLNRASGGYDGAQSVLKNH